MYKADRIVSFDSFFPIGDVIPGDIDELKLILEDDSRKPENSYDEIIPNLFIGDEFSATNIKLLQSLSITHVVNAAQGTSRFHYVDTDPSYYDWKGSLFQCNFLGLPSSDVPDFKINQYFGMATSFIEEGLRYTQNGKVLVHSLEGRSRSATIVLAYLILFRRLSVADAIKLVRRKRNVHPNDGFLKQLCDLEFVLKLQPEIESESESEEESESEDATEKGDRLNGISMSEKQKIAEKLKADERRDEESFDGMETREQKLERRGGDAGETGSLEGEDSSGSGNMSTPSKDGADGTSSSGKSKRVTFADKPQRHRHHSSPKSPSCKVHPDGKGTPPVTPENRCAIHGCKNRAQDKKKKSGGKKSPHRSPSCKVHGDSPKRVCAIHGNVTP